jgi:hypothetical protein
MNAIQFDDFSVHHQLDAANRAFGGEDATSFLESRFF